MTLLSDCYASQFHFFYETGWVFIPYCLYKCKQRNRVRIEKKLKRQRRRHRKLKTKHKLCKKGSPFFEAMFVLALYSMLKQVEFFLDWNRHHSNVGCCPSKMRPFLVVQIARHFSISLSLQSSNKDLHILFIIIDRHRLHVKADR